MLAKFNCISSHGAGGTLISLNNLDFKTAPFAETLSAHPPDKTNLSIFDILCPFGRSVAASSKTA